MQSISSLLCLWNILLKKLWDTMVCFMQLWVMWSQISTGRLNYHRILIEMDMESRNLSVPSKLLMDSYTWIYGSKLQSRLRLRLHCILLYYSKICDCDFAAKTSKRLKPLSIAVVDNNLELCYLHRDKFSYTFSVF